MADPFIPRVLRTSQGSIAIQEPGGLDHFRLVRIGDDIRALLPDATEGNAVLPAEILMTTRGLSCVELVPRPW
jgi:hypothetical protein